MGGNFPLTLSKKNMYTLQQLQQKNLAELKEIGWQLNVLPASDRRCRQNWIDAIVGVNFPLLQLLEVSPAVEEVELAAEAIAPVDPVQEPLIETVETSPGVGVDPAQKAIELQAQEAIAQAAETSPGVESDPLLGAIVSVAENSPGVEVDRVQQPIETVENFPGVERVTESNRNNFSGLERLTESNRNHFSGLERLTESNRNHFSGVEVDRVQKAIEVQAQEAIAQAVENSPGVEFDWHPILRGVTLSDRFLARYSPPQSGIIHFQSELDGQLSLLDFEVQSQPEPPDPDDFESLDAFREAIARWDTENPELLVASIDSMCEWAPCLEEWYWLKAEILPLKASSTSDLSLPSEQSEVMELSIVGESSITYNFFIPTFDAWCDRFNRSDEPPDTGIYARLPKSKPLSFPPTAVSQARVKRGLNAYQTHTKRIPKVSRTHTHCIVVGSSTQPARSPPRSLACLLCL